MNHYYLWFHFPVAIGLLMWLYWRHNDHYFYIRRLMAVVTFVALVIHVAYPLAPPRMMPGFVDTMFRYGPSIYTRNTLEGAANQIAAMPSLHFGWAVIAAMAIVQVNRSRWRYVAVLHPFLMATAIMATANHWWVDAAAAGLIIFFCWGVAKVVSRLIGARERDWETTASYTPVSRRPRRPTSGAERVAVEAVDGGERRRPRLGADASAGARGRPRKIVAAECVIGWQAEERARRPVRPARGTSSSRRRGRGPRAASRMLQQNG